MAFACVAARMLLNGNDFYKYGRSASPQRGGTRARSRERRDRFSAYLGKAVIHFESVSLWRERGLLIRQAEARC